ncbi:hypothetical protein MTR_5g005680 [Medicago truncatula]|uniref:Uncharacterized protein n=1 Tax=Medicago truncatula TaxID=3880 RepID=G7K114_MEDTR|nr:hypothetical protein MTR_5g005680 [Medicago truncatula]
MRTLHAKSNAIFMLRTKKDIQKCKNFRKRRSLFKLRRRRRHPWAAGHHAGGTNLTGEDEDHPPYAVSGEGEGGEMRFPAREGGEK